MKKRKAIVIVLIVLLAILFVPFRWASYDDGGTCEYASLTYRIVMWKKLTMDENAQMITTYKSTSVFWFPDNFKSLEELWQMETANMEEDASSP